MSSGNNVKSEWGKTRKYKQRQAGIGAAAHETASIAVAIGIFIFWCLSSTRKSSTHTHKQTHAPSSRLPVMRRTDGQTKRFAFNRSRLLSEPASGCVLCCACCLQVASCNNTAPPPPTPSRNTRTHSELASWLDGPPLPLQREPARALCLLAGISCEPPQC